MCQGFEEIFTALSVIKHLTVLGHTEVIIQIRMFTGNPSIFKKAAFEMVTNMVKK